MNKLLVSPHERASYVECLYLMSEGFIYKQIFRSLAANFDLIDFINQQFVLEGEMPDYLLAKDPSLQVSLNDLITMHQTHTHLAFLHNR